MWVIAFLDWPSDTFDQGTYFWERVSGWGLSEPRGRAGEFATFVPPAGDSYLKAQRLGAGPARVHVDVHVPDLGAASARAQELGAELLDDTHADEGFIALRSPGGLVHCVNGQPRSRAPEAMEWMGHTSRVHTVVLDLPAEAYEADCGYWAALTGTELRGFPGFPECGRLAGLDSPLQVLLQRIGSGPAGAHLDVAASDREAEVRRHVTLGAEVEQRSEHWTVMRDPTGRRYCVTEDH